MKPKYTTKGMRLEPGMVVKVKIHNFSTCGKGYIDNCEFRVDGWVAVCGPYAFKRNEVEILNYEG